MRPHIFLDCDGVLADFDTLAIEHLGCHPRHYEDSHGAEAFWSALTAHGEFFSSLAEMPDARALYDGVKHLDPTILTGCPAGRPWVRPQKAAWTAAHFPACPVAMCRSVEKARFCKPGDVLIDDWTMYRGNWEAAGGIFIHHTSAAQSLADLKAYYPQLFAAAA